MLTHFQIKKSPRRPLIVAGHCRRLLLTATEHATAQQQQLASFLQELLLRRVPPRGAARQHLEEGRNDETTI